MLLNRTSELNSTGESKHEAAPSSKEIEKKRLVRAGLRFTDTKPIAEENSHFEKSNYTKSDNLTPKNED
jgi:hypothetical protein